MSTKYVTFNSEYLPDAIINTICLTPALFLNIIIITAAISIRERYKHTIVCHCLMSIWSTFCNVSMYLIYIIAVTRGSQVSIEACSLFRSALWVSPRFQLTLLALDRYWTVCQQRPIPLKMLWFLYSLIPASVYFGKILDILIGDPVPDEMCSRVYRMTLSVQFSAVFMWFSIILSCTINLRVLLFIKFKRRQLKDNLAIRKSKKSNKLERRLTVVYLLLTIVPIVQLIPSVVVSVLREFGGYNSKVLWVVCYMFLNLTQLVQAILIIVSIKSIKRRVYGMFRRRSIPAPTPSNTNIYSTTKICGDFANAGRSPRNTREFAALLNTELMRLQLHHKEVSSSNEVSRNNSVCSDFAGIHLNGSSTQMTELSASYRYEKVKE